MDYLFFIIVSLAFITFIAWIFWPRKTPPRTPQRYYCTHSVDKDGNDIILTRAIKEDGD
jgi:hypothetical protein